MIPTYSYFDLPKGLKINECIASLEQRFAVTKNPPRTVMRRYLDTFDWRLFTANMLLESETFDGTNTFILWRREQQDILATLHASEPVRFHWDFPECALKRRLAPHMEMRALLPVASLQCRLHELNVLNKDQKTVLRLRLEQNKLLNAEGKPGAFLNRQIVVQPVRGYNKPYDAMLAFLHDHLQLQSSNRNTFTATLAKLNLQPGNYSSKLEISLDPTMRADMASKHILLHLLDTLQANEQGTLDDLDSEFLHDFRVACRRTRSALSQIKNVFPTKTVERFKREFAWLGSITGPTRDLDVYLLTFDDYKNSVPEHLQNALEPLHEFLRKQQKLEHKKLLHALQSARYQRLISAWRQFLQTPAPARTTAANGAKPIIAVANQRTWKMYRRVVEEGNAINNQSPPDDLHELRKSCKKLRYLMEFFASLYPPDKIAKLIKALKQLQTNLGDYNDLHTQIESLGRFSELMMQQEHPSAETLLAMGTLIENLNQKQLAVRRAFHSQFQQFNATHYQNLFKELFTSSDSLDTT